MDIYVAKETFKGQTEAGFESAFVESRDTMSVAIAAAAGAQVREYCRVLQPKADGTADHVVTFTLDMSKAAEFRPDFAAENLPVAEVLRRAKDDDWLEANRWHPISFGHLVLMNYRALVRATKGGTLVQIALPNWRNGRCLLLALRGDREAQRKLMRATRQLTEMQIEAIIAKLEAAA